MEEKKNFYKVIEEICVHDSRYHPDAYEFVMQALHFTQTKLKKDTHVTGKELLEGIKGFVIQQYGVMAKTVLSHWGITSTLDFGTIVFIMVNAGLLAKTETDCLDDFKDVYDFEAEFGNILKGQVIKGI